MESSIILKGWMTVIREWQAGDREILIQMMGEFYLSPAVLHPVPGEYFVRTADAIEEKSPYIAAFIAEHQEKPAGYGLVSLTYSNEVGGLVVWLEELYIREQARGFGLGTEMIAFIENRYAGRVARFRLEVEERNQGAVRLYERLGYVSLPYSQMTKDINR